MSDERQVPKEELPDLRDREGVRRRLKKLVGPEKFRPGYPHTTPQWKDAAGKPPAEPRDPRE